MPLYSNLTLEDERFVELRRFKYDFRSGEFSFSSSYKEIDEDLKEFFNPHFSTATELKTKLEDEVFALKDNPGKFDFNVSYYSKDYGLRYFRIVGSNLNDHNIVYGILYDITNEHDLLQKMNHAERLRTVGELSGGIAHEFNNNLMVISGASELLMMGDLTEKQKDYVNKIYSAAKRSAELTRKLLVFSRDSDIDEDFNLIDVIKNVVSIVSYTARVMFNINFKTDINQAYINGNVSQITNAIINLVKNAIEASLEFSDIDLYLSEEFLDRVPKNSITAVNPNGLYYKLEVKDYGTGISGENLDKIFNPFFSTKTETEGTGLGLAAVLTTVIASKGIISVDTVEGEGTTFTLYFLKNS